MKIVVSLIVFSIIILFHELGHFLLAKRAGIKVNELLAIIKEKYPEMLKSKYSLNDLDKEKK